MPEKIKPEQTMAIFVRVQDVFDGASVPTIADELGVKPQSIYQWRDGRTAPERDMLWEISRRKGVSVHWLLTGDGQKNLSGSKETLDTVNRSAIMSEGYEVVYFGEAERRGINHIAAETGLKFDQQVRELIIEILASRNLLRTEPNYIEMTHFGEHTPRLVPVPMLGEIAAGEPLNVFEQEETVFIADEFILPGRRTYVLRVRGDSMEDRIFDGDLLICYEAATAEPGQTVIALIDGEKATVKRFYREKDKIRLEPANKKFPPIVISADRVIIQGIVIGKQSRY